MTERLRTLAPSVRALNISVCGPIAAAPEARRITGRRRVERNARLKRHRPLCANCEKLGRVSAATQCDHIVPLWKGGADHDSNLQGLCDDCHDAKTAAEATERAAGADVDFGRSQPIEDVGMA